ncbi:MAG: type II toxin-antitoxin system VapC family toxin [Acidobacteria bacterium]|nr:type II toxin-antitoxin system VapC family toxin [Acidobacteriota bacterium]
MDLVIDTSAIIAVLVGERQRALLVQVTGGTDLLAPPSVHWEVGNAFSAMFKRGRLTLRQARRALEAYEDIPIRFSDVGLAQALEVSKDLDIYAYDAYVIACALKHRCALLSLDQGLVQAAGRAGIKSLEAPQ